jgi:hypothetical protein
MEQGIFGALVGAGLGAAGNLLNRGAKQRAGQQQLDLAAQSAENEFQSRHGGRFGEKGAFKNRLLGNLGNSFTNTSFGAGEPGSAGQFNLQRLDPRALFSAITSGQFGEDLRGSNVEDIESKVDFTAPKFESGSTFLGDLLGGLSGGAGGAGGIAGLFGGGGGGANPADFGNFKSVGG